MEVYIGLSILRKLKRIFPWLVPTIIFHTLIRSYPSRVPGYKDVYFS